LGTRDYWHFIDTAKGASQKTDKERNLRVTGTVQYNSGHSLVDAALKGLGIVQLPDYYVQKYIASGELVSVLDRYREPEESIWAVYPHNRHLSPKIRVLVDYLAEHLD